jgi:hypothetical protein
MLDAGCWAFVLVLVLGFFTRWLEGERVGTGENYE